MTESYDFEYRMAPPASCNRCGALVQEREIHDEWHRNVLTRLELAEMVSATIERSQYS